MPIWNCLITGTQPDGSYTWRRIDAAQPRGVLPLDKTPEGAKIGDEVTITAERGERGEWDVTRCRLREAETFAHGCLRFEPPPTDACQVQSHIHFGEIRWTNVRNPLENARAIGKYRPALMVSEHLGRWRVMGLTTKPTYENGSSRRAIPDYRAIGLETPGYLWGHKLTRVNVDDVGQYIGKADQGLLNEVLQQARADLTMDEIAMIRRGLAAR